MSVEPPYRSSTMASIDVLADSLKLPNHSNMQDWAIEVADSNRISEFMKAYSVHAEDSDIQFTLMDMLLQSFEELEGNLEVNDEWLTVIGWIENNFKIHAYQVWHWSAFENTCKDAWKVSPFMREIWSNNSLD